VSAIDFIIVSKRLGALNQRCAYLKPVWGEEEAIAGKEIAFGDNPIARQNRYNAE
jgi:hypothetical protein